MTFNTTISTLAAAVTDDHGVDVADWTSATTLDGNVPASVQQMGENEVFSFARRGATVDFDVFTRTRLTAGKDDRLVDAAGATYQIVVPTEDMAGRGRMFRTICKKLSAVGV